MAVWALGINHTTAPLDMRGRFAFGLEQIAPTLQSLRENFAAHSGREPEAAILSTCNRTEIYCAGAGHEIDPTLEWLAHSRGVAPQDTPGQDRASGAHRGRASRVVPAYRPLWDAQGWPLQSPRSP